MRHFSTSLRDFSIDFEALWNFLPCGWDDGGFWGKQETKKMCRERVDNKLFRVQ